MTKLTEEIEARLRAAAPHGLELKRQTTPKGVVMVWGELADPADLLALADQLKRLDARFSTVSAFQPKPPKGAPAGSAGHELAYHFDLDGDTLTIMVRLPAENAEIDSLSPIFRNATWVEREFMEIYAITVKNHPDPRRLFIDESVDPAVLERLIPLSTLSNAATTKALWERVLGKKGGPA